MRTLAQMIERVKIHVRGKENLTWKTSDYEEMLAEAATRMWHAIVETPAKVYLRASQTSVLGSAGTVICPSDCMRIERVMLRLDNGNYVPLPFMPDDGHDILLDVSCFPNCCCAPGWTDDLSAGLIRVLNVKAGKTVRVDYFRMPVFPFEDTGTFAAPDGGANETYNIPPLCDSACEHLAAALLLGEEISDTNPMSYHGNQYVTMLQGISKSVVAKPSRTYIKRVRRRFF